MKHSDFYIFNQVIDWLWKNRNDYAKNDLKVPYGMPKGTKKFLSERFIDIINENWIFILGDCRSKSEMFKYFKEKLFGDIPDNVIPNGSRGFFNDADDKRFVKLCEQHTKQGWNDSETWSLDSEIAKFVCPRLKRFREINNGFPADSFEKEWDKQLDTMIYAFKVASEGGDYYINGKEIDWEKVKKGFRLFGEHFRELWW